MVYKKKKVKVPKGYAKAVRNAIPLGDLLSGKISLGNIMNMGATTKGLNIGKGPGTHIPVKESGKTIGTMADGKKIWLKGPKKGQMV